jgi:hypothetical protein
MAEALQKFMREIADMKTLPDADLPFLIQMENMVIERLKRPVEMLRQEGQLPPAGGPGGGSSMGMPAGQMQAGGLQAGAVAPNADELSRLLNAGNA